SLPDFGAEDKPFVGRTKQRHRSKYRSTSTFSSYLRSQPFQDENRPGHEDTATDFVRLEHCEMDHNVAHLSFPIEFHAVHRSGADPLVPPSLSLVAYAKESYDRHRVLGTGSLALPLEACHSDLTVPAFMPQLALTDLEREFFLGGIDNTRVWQDSSFAKSEE